MYKPGIHYEGLLFEKKKTLPPKKNARDRTFVRWIYRTIYRTCTYIPALVPVGVAKTETRSRKNIESPKIQRSTRFQVVHFSNFTTLDDVLMTFSMVKRRWSCQSLINWILWKPVFHETFLIQHPAYRMMQVCVWYWACPARPLHLRLIQITSYKQRYQYLNNT